MDEALRVLRRELRAFTDTGLFSLLADLTAGQRDPDYLPGRRTWCSCPLSYRGGFRGSVDRDSEGYYTNAFTLAWDGEDGQDYFDEATVLNEVVAEIAYRRRPQKRKKRKTTKHRKAVA